MKTGNPFIDQFIDFFDEPIFHIGGTPITIASLLYLFIAILVLFFVSGWLKRIITRRLSKIKGITPSRSRALGSFVRNFTIGIGLIVIIQSSGIDISALGILAGGLGVGLGLGLQNIANDFFSGLIIWLERPVKIGDRIELDAVTGNVTDIAMRTTTVLTNDNISVIVPNSKLISAVVINWSHNDRNVRFKIPVGVSYGEDPEVVKKLLLEVAEENDAVLKNPAPDVWFDNFGDSSLNFNLVTWTTQFIDRPFILRSQLNFAIFAKFKEHNIQIPFPQRDLHLKSGFEALSK